MKNLLLSSQFSLIPEKNMTHVLLCICFVADASQGYINVRICVHVLIYVCVRMGVCVRRCVRVCVGECACICVRWEDYLN
uniref:Uncharacterized protein n=1 Tax=Anguilla anguilla TaxID=7936 RepID=A0A0E9WLI6_ANGAN